MRHYHRAFVPGGTFFFTVNLADRSTSLLTDHIDPLRDNFRIVRERHPFHIEAMVVLPDHLHALWTLPPEDTAYPTRWALIKAGFSRQLPKTERINASRRGKGERGIWQRRYWEHLIRDEADFERHVDYIHYNPVKHGHARSATDWPFSSIHRFIREQRLPANWGGVEISGGEWGE